MWTLFWVGEGRVDGGSAGYVVVLVVCTQGCMDYFSFKGAR